MAKGERKIPLNEAAAVADLLGVSISRMLGQPERTPAQIVWEEQLEDFRQAYYALLVARNQYESDRHVLRAIS